MRSAARRAKEQLRVEFARARLVAALLLVVCAAPAAAQEFTGFSSSGGHGVFGLFDEVRAGTVFSIQPDDDSGVILSGQLYFRPFGPPSDNYIVNTVLRPRLFIGGNVATAEDGVSQLYGGFTWHFPLPYDFFVEASFGGTVHNGPLQTSGAGLDLGCHALFRESIAAGVDLGERWRLVASVDHSSNNGFCPLGNSGISHAGVYAGYRF